MTFRKLGRRRFSQLITLEVVAAASATGIKPLYQSLIAATPSLAGQNNRKDKSIRLRFFDAENFSEGLAKVRVFDEKTEKWGYINKQGKLVIKPQFEIAENFSEGLAIARMSGGRSGYINKSGKFVLHFGGRTFSEGLAAVIDDNEKWGFIDKTGKFAIQPQFEYVENFSEGLASVKINDKSGYIDKTGKLVIPAQFNIASDFSNGMAAVDIDSSTTFTENSITITLSNPGYIDKMGKLVIQPSPDIRIHAFSEGLAVAQINGKYGFVNKTGKVVIPPKFDRALDFFEGLAAVGIVYGSEEIAAIEPIISNSKFKLKMGFDR